MYAETELFYPYLQNFSQDFQHFEDFCKTQKPNASMNDLVQISNISDYDLGGEGDLFKAPEPIIEEPSARLDHMSTAISFSCAGDVITSQGFEAADVESMRNEQFLEALYECENDLMARAALETQLTEVLDVKIPIVKADENQDHLENDTFCDVPFHKSVSSGCLSSMEWMQRDVVESSFLDFPGTDFGSVYGMRRAFSEGDIQALGNRNASVVHSPLEQPRIVSSCSIEDRKEKLSRYRNKKTKRNFGRKIKYACRKALADSQPRIRGRFAKTEESDNSKRQ